MLHVVKATYEEEIELYNQALAHLDDPRERLLAFPEVAWEVLARPAGVAVLEIIQGSRSDPTLSARLKPLQKEIEQDSFKQVAAILGNAGAKASAAATRLFVWALRGLSVARVLTDEPAEIERSVELLRRMLVAAIETDVIKLPKPAARRKPRR